MFRYCTSSPSTHSHEIEYLAYTQIHRQDIALRNISPSPDDLPKLKGYDGDLAKLDEVCSYGGAF